MGIGRGQARPRAGMASGTVNGLKPGLVGEILDGLEICMAADASHRPAVSGGAESVGVEEDRFAVLPRETFIAVAFQAVRIFDLNGRRHERPDGQNKAEDERGSFHGVTWPAPDA